MQGVSYESMVLESLSLGVTWGLDVRDLEACEWPLARLRRLQVLARSLADRPLNRRRRSLSGLAGLNPPCMCTCMYTTFACVHEW